MNLLQKWPTSCAALIISLVTVSGIAQADDALLKIDTNYYRDEGVAVTSSDLSSSFTVAFTRIDWIIEQNVFNFVSWFGPNYASYTATSVPAYVASWDYDGGGTHYPNMIFYRGLDNRLKLNEGAGEENLGGVLTSAPATAVRWSGSFIARLDVFYRGQNSHLWHRWMDASGWSYEEDLGGILTSAPAAVASWGNRIDVFYRGQNGHIWNRQYNGFSWGVERDIGGNATSAPAVAASSEGGVNYLDLVYRGGTNNLVHRWFDGVSWSNEENLGGRLSSAPAITSVGSSLDILYVGWSGGLWRKPYRPGGWGPEQNTGLW